MVSKLLIFILQGIRPLLGTATCKFSLSCTPYAIYQLHNEPLHKALWAITKRVLSCNPLCNPKDRC